MFWDELKNFFWNLNLPWVVMGYFNDIMNLNKKCGSFIFCANRARVFMEKWEACQLSNTGALGTKFTSVRKLNGKVVIREWLNRALLNSLALENFCEAKVVNLPCLCSNHHPILFHIAMTKPPARDKSLYPFQAAWLTHWEFDSTFIAAWEHGDSFLQSVISTTAEVKKWSFDCFGDIMKKREDIDYADLWNPEKWSLYPLFLCIEFGTRVAKGIPRRTTLVSKVVCAMDAR